MPPQNMLIWHEDYFRLVNFKQQQTWSSSENQVEVTFCRWKISIGEESPSLNQEGDDLNWKLNRQGLTLVHCAFPGDLY